MWPDSDADNRSLGSSGASPNESEKLAVQVARLLEDEIVARRWPIGEPIGTEAELQERFSVSKAVLREAIQLLEHRQVAEMRRGRVGGLRVRAPSPSPTTRALVIYLEYAGVSGTDLIHARRVLDPLASEWAALNINPDGAAQLQSLREDPRSSSVPADAGAEPLVALLGRLSGNPLLHAFLDVLVQLSSRLARQLGVERLAGQKCQPWNGVVEDVIAGDGRSARLATVRHLDEVEAWIQQHPVADPAVPMRTRPSDPAPDPIDVPGRKRAAQVARQIHDDIIASGLPVGEVLGAETELLARYAVSRDVFRASIRILEFHHVVKMRRGPGGGLVILAPDPASGIQMIALSLDHQGLTFDQLQAVWTEIEQDCLRTALASLKTDAAKSDLVAQLRRSISDPHDDGARGERFHLMLAAVTGNPILVLFVRIISELSARLTRVSSIHDQPSFDEADHAHLAIVDALETGSMAKADRLVRNHMRAHRA